MNVPLRLFVPILLLALALLGSATTARAQDTSADTLPPRLANVDEVTGQLMEAYPAELQADGLGGVLRLKIFVDAEGRADTVHIVSSTGFLSLDGAARSVLARATFLPAQGPGGAHADWLDYALHFGDPELHLDREISIDGRTEALERGRDDYPRELRGSGINVQVPVGILLDGTGRVIEQEAIGSTCFPTAAAAARELTGVLDYEARTGDPEDRFLSAATVSFAGDSVTLRLRGDTILATPRPVRVPVTGPSRRPEMRNPRSVQRLLRQNYPPDLRRMGLGGTVNVRVFVDADGRVERRMVNRSSGECEFDLAALAAARSFRFRPALRGGEPIGVWVAFDLTFEVQR